MKKTYLIICLSNQFFETPFKTNKHLVMRELANEGHKVIFVNPPTRFKWISYRRQQNKLIANKGNITEITLFTIFNFPPFSLATSFAHYFIIWLIIQLNGWQSLPSVLWVYHFDFPRLFKLVQRLKADLLLYDVVDSYPDFPEYSDADTKYVGLMKRLLRFDQYLKMLFEQGGKTGQEWVFHREAQLAEKAQLLFTSHPSLTKRFKALNKNIHYLPNAGAYSLYSKPYHHEPNELQQLKRPIVGYSGALDAYKFDAGLFSEIVEENKDVTFVLIGPLKLSDSNTSIQKVLNFQNVNWLGVKSFEEVAVFTNYFDAYIIPYIKNNYTLNGCFPVKLFNAMATGIPIVVTDLPIYEHLSEVIYIAKNKQMFNQLLSTALNEKDDEKRLLRREIAKHNDWTSKVRRQIHHIDTMFSEIYHR
ncbi:MAG: glycosyltransferase [Ardenticatenaceae bacterium]|nr:glycosyltransferase [Ardenticatenaceae bacterium]